MGPGGPMGMMSGPGGMMGGPGMMSPDGGGLMGPGGGFGMSGGPGGFMGPGEGGGGAGTGAGTGGVRWGGNAKNASKALRGREQPRTRRDGKAASSSRPPGKGAASVATVAVWLSHGIPGTPVNAPPDAPADAPPIILPQAWASQACRLWAPSPSSNSNNSNSSNSSSSRTPCLTPSACDWAAGRVAASWMTCWGNAASKKRSRWRSEWGLGEPVQDGEMNGALQWGRLGGWCGH